MIKPHTHIKNKRKILLFIAWIFLDTWIKRHTLPTYCTKSRKIRGLEIQMWRYPHLSMNKDLLWYETESMNLYYHRARNIHFSPKTHLLTEISVVLHNHRYQSVMNHIFTHVQWYCWIVREKEQLKKIRRFCNTCCVNKLTIQTVAPSRKND